MFEGSVVSTVHSIDWANLNLYSFGKHVRKSKKITKKLNFLQYGAIKQPKAMDTDDHRKGTFEIENLARKY